MYKVSHTHTHIQHQPLSEMQTFCYQLHKVCNWYKPSEQSAFSTTGNSTISRICLNYGKTSDQSKILRMQNREIIMVIRWSSSLFLCVMITACNPQQFPLNRFTFIDDAVSPTSTVSLSISVRSTPYRKPN